MVFHLKMIKENSLTKFNRYNIVELICRNWRGCLTNLVRMFWMPQRSLKS
ncbi:hypothetical protein Gogos_006118 [Gossypium gossypioides]|uniref:Uncharacterized protein n=1 Tax=Gossypium gossypioides TaxID=34282 RepID=A0A7J9C4N4_GOSGO|nr:hypothetical protein [Gossypium gossypioides]